MNEQPVSPLLPFGVGVGVGVMCLWALVELFPLIALGGAGFLVVKGLKTTNISKEDTNTCSIGQQVKQVL